MTLGDADRRLLAQAVRAGRRGWGRVHPNPMVGAVVARDGTVLAEAHHQEFGGPHAEAAALAGLGDAARGATLYCSLEPCRHSGKTPPCTTAVRDSGVARVVYWAADPSPLARGGGEWLQWAGVRVDGPFGEPREWAAENPSFFHAAAGPSRPFVALKLAASLDGGIAPPGGRRMWLTGPEARTEVHRLRAGFDAVLVGRGTWQADDPSLTARGPVTPRIPPLRVLLDRKGRIGERARALDPDCGAPSLVATSPDRAHRLRNRLKGRAEVAAVPPAKEGRPGLDLHALLRDLARRGATSVLCEGGGRVAASLLAGDLVDRLYHFVAPVFLGPDATPAFPFAAAAPFTANAPPAANAPLPANSPLSGQPTSTQHSGWRLAAPPTRFGNDTLTVLDRDRSAAPARPQRRPRSQRPDPGPAAAARG